MNNNNNNNRDSKSQSRVDRWFGVQAPTEHNGCAPRDAPSWSWPWFSRPALGNSQGWTLMPEYVLLEARPIPNVIGYRCHGANYERYTPTEMCPVLEAEKKRDSFFIPHQHLIFILCPASQSRLYNTATQSSFNLAVKCRKIQAVDLSHLSTARTKTKTKTKAKKLKKPPGSA